MNSVSLSHIFKSLPIFNKTMPISTTSLKNSSINRGDLDISARPKGTICIEGNIGCGKTTLLDFFKTQYKTVFAEPVECWRNVDGENLFHHLYKDPVKFSLPFQTYVQLTMIKQHRRRPTLMERSIYSARYCFVENLFKLNCLSRVEYIILHKWFKYLVCDMEDDKTDANETTLLENPKSINIDLIIYLRCSPKNALDRIRMRSRVEESSITFDYLNSLHQLHEDWLINRKFPVPAPVLVLDTDCSQSSLSSLYKKASPYISGAKKITENPVIITINE